MNRLNKTAQLFGKGAVSLVVLAAVSLGAWAQKTTATKVKHGPASYETQVRNAEVVYVEGNDLVLKTEGGKIEHLVVPDSDIFSIDGKDLTVSELRPGTKLTQTITTSTTPRYVNTVETIEGKVWHVNAPGSVILTLPDNTNHIYKVPRHATFTVNGKNKTVFDLKKGMTFKATAVSDSEEVVTARVKSVVGQAPPPAMPGEVGVLLFLQTAPPPATLASAEMLPQTGSLLPLMGLLGGGAVALSFGLGAVRRRVSL
jgi:LPXTG-motif cell wall-anchored protein